MSLNLQDLSNAVAQLVETAGASIVRVEARHHRGASGVVWAADGSIVTTSHAIQREEGITVTLADGRAFPATLAGRDPGTDLALLKVQATGLTPLAFAETDGVKVGHLVVNVARPGKTVRAATGHVGTFGEGFRTPFGSRIERYLEVDRDLPPGFSGGALLDAQGRALGIATSGLFRGTNLAIPAATVRRVLGELQSHGKMPRGYLGVAVYPVRFSPAQEKAFGQKGGVVLVSVEPGSAADQGGLQLGDVLLAIDGQALEGPRDLVGVLADRVDAEVTVKLARAGTVQDAKVKVGQRA